VTVTADANPLEMPWPRPLHAWYVIAVLDVAALLSYVDRFILGVLIDPIRRDLHISDTQIGLISGSAFALFYGFWALPLGRLADRKTRVYIIAAGVLCWSIMTAACGLTKTFWQLFVARMGVGIGEASLASSAYSLITDYFPPTRLALAIGAYVGAVMLGSGVGLLVGGWVIHVTTLSGPMELPLLGSVQPWQTTLLAVGLPGIFVSVLVLTVREPIRRSRAHDKDSQGASIARPRVIGFMKTRARVLTLHHLGFSVAVMYAYSVFIWTPTFFIRTYGWTAAESGTRFGLVVLLFGVTGVLCGGVLADTLARRGVTDAAMRIALYSLVLLVPISVIAPLMSSGTRALLMFGVVVFLFSVPSAVAPTALQLITPNEMRGQVTSFFGLTSVVIGLGCGPPLVALLTDHVFRDSGRIAYSLSFMGGLTALASSLMMALCLRPYARARDLASRGMFAATAQ
jgi:MFS family permease